MAKKLELLYSKETFVGVQADAILIQTFENLFYVVKMLCFRVACDQYIVDVRKNER